MKLTTRTEYGLLALIFLARHDSEANITIETIASEQDIPRKYLEQILLSLKRAGYATSAKGQRGGYRLARPASRITVAEIIRLFDGPLAPTGSVSRHFYESTPIESERKLTAVLRDVRRYTARKLESTTIADVA